MNDLFDVSGKVVMVTGGSRGLGKAMVMEFAQATFKTASSLLSPEKLPACEVLPMPQRSS